MGGLGSLHVTLQQAPGGGPPSAPLAASTGLAALQSADPPAAGPPALGAAQAREETGAKPQLAKGSDAQTLFAAAGKPVAAPEPHASAPTLQFALAQRLAATEHASPGAAAQDALTGGASSLRDAAPALPAPPTPAVAAPGSQQPMPANPVAAYDQLRPTAAASPAEQVAVQIHKASHSGSDKVKIKLHPAELGRIEVRVELSESGVLRAVVSAERSETLDLLQRDSRGLERALQEAGLKTDSQSLAFNRQGAQSRAETGGQGGPSSEDPAAQVTDAPAGQDPPHGPRHDGLIDISV